MFGSSSTSTGLFGQSNQGGSLFGQKPAATPAPPSGSMFGQKTNTTPQPQSGGLFGGSQPQNQGSGLFGSQNNQPSNQSNTTGGLFGSTNNQPASGGLFGSQNTNQNTNQNPSNAQSNGLFGSLNTQSGGLFGNNQAKPQSGGLFGGQSQNTQSGGLFGNQNQNTQSGGLFGSNTTNQNGPQNTQTQSGGLFGGNNQNGQQNNQSSGLFGGNNNQSGGLFGQKPASTQTGGLFGQNSQPNQNQSSGLFGNQPQNNTNNGGLFTSQNALSAPTSYTPAINDQLAKVKENWDPNSPKCALKTHLYNKFNEQEINTLLNQPRPQNESPEDWDSAMSNRPSALHYPVKITSFTEVAQRIETQLDHVAKSRVLLNAINDQVSSLSSKHDLDNTSRILKAKAKHVKLSRRLLRLATVLAILKLKGYPLLPEEEEISKQFDALNTKLNNPNGSLGKLNDVFARLAILKERSEELNSSLGTMIGNVDSGSKERVEEPANDELINKLSRLLLKQQMGLNYLNEVLEKDVEAVNKMK